MMDDTDLLRMPPPWYIVHQTHASGRGNPAGLADAVFRKFPHANVYTARRPPPDGYNRPSDIPGTVSIHDRVVNLYGQNFPGSPYRTGESMEMRFAWFQEALQDLGAKLAHLAQGHVAFPSHIGCARGGGDWTQYLRQIRLWAAEHPHLQVVVCCFDVE